MRERLSELLSQAAFKDPRIIILSGDHGYSLFDRLRKERPGQFLNCGIAEQSMVGIAAGLAIQGFRPIVYGLAAFIPVRVLEQIKLDICFSKLPVLFLGDGAGLVYSTLGASHHAAEDIAALRPLPHMTLYSPCDAEELDVCFHAALKNKAPSYIRIGKSDRAQVCQGKKESADFWVTHRGPAKRVCVAATGSMVSPATAAAKKHGVDCVSVPVIHPVSKHLIEHLSVYRTVIVVEEHSEHGGLFSGLAEQFVKRYDDRPRIIPLTLKHKFADKCGSYQYALSEHELDDASIERRVNQIVNFT